MTSAPYNEAILNVGNSIFPGFNDKHGIMLCGYEWGDSKHDKYLENNHKEAIEEKKSRINTFYEKAKIYDSPYDKKIIKWFSFFGHPLGADGGFSSFDKCVLQTNWCDDQGTYVSDYSKFLSKENSENFLQIVEAFLPRVLIFMGSKQIHYLHDPAVIDRFSEAFGPPTSELVIQSKPFIGRKFKIGFRSFENVNVISLPHPSGTKGLSHEYIKLFSPEINRVLDSYKKFKRI